mgnify:CR=1 FL=1
MALYCEVGGDTNRKVDPQAHGGGHVIRGFAVVKMRPYFLAYLLTPAAQHGGH